LNSPLVIDLAVCSFNSQLPQWVLKAKISLVIAFTIEYVVVSAALSEESYRVDAGPT